MWDACGAKSCSWCLWDNRGCQPVFLLYMHTASKSLYTHYQERFSLKALSHELKIAFGMNPLGLLAEHFLFTEKQALL